MSEILNKKALVEVVAEKLEMTKKDATVAVETVFDEIATTLSTHYRKQRPYRILKRNCC